MPPKLLLSAVAPTPYAPQFRYDSGTARALVNEDDIWSDAIALPFNFCFFGQIYDSLIIGSNGVISFNVSNADVVNNWYIEGPAPFTYETDLDNSIMAPWQDLDPTIEGKYLLPDYRNIAHLP